jgi:hypothetical protein
MATIVIVVWDWILLDAKKYRMQQIIKYSGATVFAAATVD